MALTATSSEDGEQIEVLRREVIDILRDYGRRENEDSYKAMDDNALVEEFLIAGNSGPERDYLRECAADDYLFVWDTLAAAA